MPTDPFDLDDLSPVGTSSQASESSQEPLYLTELNEAQKEAVLTLEGPVLMLAGAGTGKTKALTSRLAHIVHTRTAAPWNILSVTFTNKAAREMQDRVAVALGQSVEGLWFGTFHSICNKILRRHAELVGLQPNFTILDTDDQIRLLKQLIKAEGIDDKKWPARQMAGLIDRWKNKAIMADKLPSSEGSAFANGLGGKIYSLYQERLKILNAVDFGDLILLNIHLFQTHPDILSRYHSQFRYLLVDEYQDTNVAQYLWLRLLAQKSKNICCVGDDDQSIYGWRGAEVGNILRFSEDFPGAKVVRLEQNYRSTGHILAAASKLIAGNENRLGKTLWTAGGDGDPIKVRGVWDAPEEARTIGDEVESLQRKHVALNEIAILVRAGFQTREFEERMLTLGLPYRIIGGPRFYERAEIRDALAYLRVVAQPDDDLAFERIVNTPKRGIGQTSVQKVHEMARELGTSVSYAVRHAVSKDRIRGKAKTNLVRLMDDFDRWRGLSRTLSHTDLAETILDESGYTEMWQNDKAPDAPGRLENLKELINAMGEFDSLAGFLEHIGLVMENDERAGEDKVTIMTLHASKGLEFEHVFLPGWEEGVFPSQRSLDETGLKGLEEERRLAYVGITRAREQAYVFYAANRQIFGQWTNCVPSRFIEELPEEHIELDAAQGLYGSKQSSGYEAYSQRNSWQEDDWQSSGATNRSGETTPYVWGQTKSKDNRSDYGDKFGPGWKRAQKLNEGKKFLDLTPASQIRAKKKQTSQKKTVSRYAIGERVFHDKFGGGIIEDIEGDKLLVNFDHAGEKRIIDRFVKPA
ncbi:UvrD-helicase domain-containing protein [Temperatibacter marinus]|uniref:DNA 3'-5' helicase n=1 Tax=Temperatibacter marinus TaxID=1456591 RepID=A0AA52ECF0_9PROT|nr:UvrD-helicase domain-containing protein [Temperatibacter marinus]WND02837.1 UvrD-helicase domain-containing protein [Temperatibacter marinus]